MHRTMRTDKLSPMDESILEKIGLSYGCKICNGVLMEVWDDNIMDKN